MNWFAFNANAAARVFLEHVLNALPEGILIALLAWALLRVFRRHNSGTRFAVWFVALLTVAALPLLTLFWPAHKLVAGLHGGPSFSLASVKPALTIPLAWGWVICAVWLLGAGMGLARLLMGLWQLRELRLSCDPVQDSDLSSSVRRTVHAMAPGVTLARSDRVSVPVAMGLWSRTIILPSWAWRELTAQDLHTILLHESAHLRRGDDWTNLIQKVVRALFFFHPAVWWIERRLSEEREMACDDAVLAATGNARGYARCLVSVLEKSLTHRHLTNPRWSMAQAAVGRAREAAVRLAQILDENRPVATRISRPALAMVGVLTLACLMASTRSPQIIAVDQGASVGESAGADSITVSQARPESVPPFRGESPVAARPVAGASTHLSPTKAATRGVSQRATPPLPELASISLEAEPVPLIEASVEQAMIPHFQTVVLIQATPFVTLNSSGWRVQMWRVTLRMDRTVSAELPVLNSI
jgi:beta-lactamase regulating signal transducer with metallopeptidase domain